MHCAGAHTQTRPQELSAADGLKTPMLRKCLRRHGTIDGTAVIAYVCTADVPSVDQYVERAIRAGGQVALPKMPIPGVGWLAYCKDTEGNIFGMMQMDRTVQGPG